MPANSEAQRRMFYVIKKMLEEKDAGRDPYKVGNCIGDCPSARLFRYYEDKDNLNELRKLTNEYLK